MRKELLLKISDEGRGIDSEVLKDINSGTGVIGVGMAGMRERTQAMKGQLYSVSENSNGTTIEISLPFINITDHATL